ncbi:molybdenum cofactor guanylyltransferase MobA [Methylotuvimicrobium alcaliphilum]|uniref:Molybdenum cofactor guanylyltransferase n=1 Tax=Methylotuvimicrobium alcaliphilum (strain DSM 19304 / NCIMB 14124 / VKM B-2133 / 20Z) TaxID=1091494 RepID=G4T2D6_META2|nr:molybdenum cofactor guanylyltransferase MobA [Methylotuvimicrobium alcaliphilum]CCE23576.1 putative molybdopterin-guanine dinucleotide biosynthesis protein A [Methylotuvimicrobium alcaliphilum 20Z]
MSNPTKVTGVILAGGLARRMNNQDKGLVLFHRRPMVSYAIDSIKPLVDQVIINANRNLDAYSKFGLPVVSDQNGNFEGPLAGILSAMAHADAGILLVMPCDSPLIKTDHLQRLLKAGLNPEIDVAVAFDGERLHPVFLAIKTTLESSLIDYLGSGERKIDRWLMKHRMTQVDFSDAPEVFVNVNTLGELSALEGQGNE